MRRHATAAVPRAAALGLVLALTALILGAGASRALAQADNGLASITIYSAFCPVGYTGTNYFDDCFNNPQKDIPYLLTGPAFPETVTATSDASGLTAYEDIDQAGDYLLQLGLPGEATDFVAYCADEFGVLFPVTDRSDLGGIGLDLTLDDDLRCDFYITPLDLRGEPTARLIIHNRVCPVEYSGTDYFTDCHGNVATDQTFVLDGPQTRQGGTGSDGNVSFDGLAAGTYAVSGGPPGDFILRTAIFCAPASGPGSPFPFTQNDGDAGFTITLAEDDDVICDVYSVPENLSGITPTPVPTTAPSPAPTAPISVLPNTGTGATSGDVGNGTSWLLAALVTVFITSAGLAACRRRVQPAKVRARR